MSYALIWFSAREFSCVTAIIETVLNSLRVFECRMAASVVVLGAMW